MWQGIYRKGAQMKKITLRKFLAVHIPAAVVIVLYIILPIGCPIKYFLHIDCPACGSTRAIISLLRGDIRAYFTYNPVALPLLAVVLFALHKGLFNLNRRTEMLIIISIAVCVFIAYIFRIIFMQ